LNYIPNPAAWQPAHALLDCNVCNPGDIAGHDHHVSGAPKTGVAILPAASMQDLYFAMDMIRKNYSRLNNERPFLHNVLKRLSEQSNVFRRRENWNTIVRDDCKEIGATRNIHPFIMTHDNSLSVFSAMPATL
jgi:hypothetical protein